MIAISHLQLTRPVRRIATMSTIQAIAFDAVGTLLHCDPPALAVYTEVAACYGSRLSEVAIGSRFRQAFLRQEEIDRNCNWRTNEEREYQRWHDIVAETLDDVADPDAAFATLHAHFAQPAAWAVDAEAARVVADLAAKGYRLGLASNFDRRLRAVVAGHASLQSILSIVISSEVGWRKPAQQFYESLAHSLDLNPESISFVGDDWENDYAGATRAGLKAVLLDRAGNHVHRNVCRIGCLSELQVG